MTPLRRLALALLLPLIAAGCAETVMDPDVEVARRAYSHDGPPALTLYTMTNTRSGSGDHSALLINADQRVLFDPFGTFHLPQVPEQRDVLYGFTPNVHKVYIDFHARETYDVREQRVEVSPAVARQALRLAQSNGAVGPARCTISIANILRQLPGFEDAPATFFPNRLAAYFAGRPDVQERRIGDDDADDNHGVLIRAAQNEIREEIAY
ncbi:hypothetical protein SAMN04490244_102121 [Tranquillimonas rosea]|uniref:Lipoprotein n=1 Tax=Tranquillimonas rosea TaxID=641238 RepID=A0A1H9R3Y9_9RHOB|nr:hypothetical protein [Tranquillimonas rosea]SER67561.1 hypothetical protein SAMN04490244_102121 [Tranquillimonas rosea]